MDKQIILDADQLAVLKRYIKARGFRDPAVVIEILDHFACKVEELMIHHPSLALETAMQRAHASFGVAGFRPMVVAYEQELATEYKLRYKAGLKETLNNLPLMIVFVVAGFGFSQLYLWTLEHHFQVLDFNILYWFTIIVMSGFNLVMNGGRKRKGFLESAIGMAGQQSGKTPLLLKVLLLAVLMSLNKFPLITSAYFGVLGICVAVHLHTSHRLMKYAKQQFDRLCQLAE